MQVEGAGRGLRFPWEHQLLGWRLGGGWSTPRLRREIPSVTCQPQGDGGLGGRQALPGGRDGGRGQRRGAGESHQGWLCGFEPGTPPSVPQFPTMMGLTGFSEGDCDIVSAFLQAEGID